MTGDAVEIAAVLLAGGALVALIGWLTPVPRLTSALSAGLLAVAGLVAALADPTLDVGAGHRTALVAAAAGLALLGGGPVTTVVFDLVDRPGTPREDSVQRAGEVLRGGAWIGALERLAAFAAVVTGWPEGLAVVLAVKGLARYPELHSGFRLDRRRATAERFIIGTFTSVLWALACAAVVVLVLPDR